MKFQFFLRMVHLLSSAYLLILFFFLETYSPIFFGKYLFSLQHPEFVGLASVHPEYVTSPF
jgi:hypothetical protein